MEADDGVKVGGSVGWVVAEEEANADGDGEAEDDPKGRYIGGDGGKSCSDQECEE